MINFNPQAVHFAALLLLLLLSLSTVGAFTSISSVVVASSSQKTPLLLVSTTPLSSPSPSSLKLATTADSSYNVDNNNNILILDHLNINHEKGRHDLVKGFYVDLLQLSLDPRKIENVQKGSKTVWTNIGCQQFHLPEGKPCIRWSHYINVSRY